MATSTVKPELPALKTPLTAPLSATYPSELRSPAVGTPTYIKREDAMKTPITPPVAYLDFLNKLSPTILSPQSAGALVTFSLAEKLPLTSTAPSDSVATTNSSASLTSTAAATATTTMATATAMAVATATTTVTGTGISRPASPRSNPSRASSCSGESQKSETTTATATTQPKPTPVSMAPSSFARPLSSARTPRRLHIPQSPYSPASVRSPLSAASVYSPYSSTMSPREWDPEKQGALSSGSTRAVSVRQVVTRTVTYSSRTPIVEPVPANKKRKLDN